MILSTHTITRLVSDLLSFPESVISKENRCCSFVKMKPKANYILFIHVPFSIVYEFFFLYLRKINQENRQCTSVFSLGLLYNSYKTVSNYIFFVLKQKWGFQDFFIEKCSL